MAGGACLFKIAIIIQFEGESSFDVSESFLILQINLSLFLKIPPSFRLLSLVGILIFS